MRFLAQKYIWPWSRCAALIFSGWWRGDSSELRLLGTTPMPETWRLSHILLGVRVPTLIRLSTSMLGSCRAFQTMLQRIPPRICLLPMAPPPVLR
uniref:Uncharacterized protein n=1 Tax=Ixodes ricinus TaxID=34613 RepID=A0A6B0U5R7_IXORI